VSRCLAEFCANWTGDGCICQVLDLDPVDARPAELCVDCGLMSCRPGEAACVECEPSQASDWNRL